MTDTFENEYDVIVYTLEKIISYSGGNQYIFVAQSVWWLASIIRLQGGLVIHIDNLKVRVNIGNHGEEPTVTGKNNIHLSRIHQVWNT